MEGLLRRDAPRNCRWVCHALRSGVHLSSHDVWLPLQFWHWCFTCLIRYLGTFCTFLFLDTLPACHQSTCVLECLRSWAPYWPTSMLTTLTQPRPPTMYLPRTVSLPPTLGWVLEPTMSPHSENFSIKVFAPVIWDRFLCVFYRKSDLSSFWTSSTTLLGLTSLCTG